MLLACLLVVPTVWAEDEPSEGAFQYDETNLEIERGLVQFLALQELKSRRPSRAAAEADTTGK